MNGDTTKRPTEDVSENGVIENNLMDDGVIDNGVDDNLYVYAAGARSAQYLESTQLNKFGTKGGTGFAAEDANALNEKLKGVKVDQVGTSNAKNGADRVSGGVHIQTKYFDTAAKTVGDSFDRTTGEFRYPGMQLEVPSDQYDKAVSLMREEISAGKVPGVANPDDAGKLIKQGSFTYQQARNIARAGNLDSLIYDAKNNAVTSGYAFAIGFAINVARAKWEGRSTKDALKESVGMGLLSAGTSFIAGVATSQLLRTDMARKATILVRVGIKALARTEWGRIAVDRIATAAAGKPLSGAAATNYVSRLFRSNVITGVVTTIAITGPDIYRAAIAKNTSWKQVGKNLIVNGAGVAAGTAGWAGGAAAGAAIGTAVFPGPGTVVGTVTGGIIGSMAAGVGTAYATKKAMDYVIEDDTEQLVRILEKVLPVLADEYLMTQAEFDKLLVQVREECTASFFRKMYSHDARELFVRVNFEPNCEAIIRERKLVVPPIEEEVHAMLNDILASIDSDEEENTMSADYVPNFVLVAVEFEPAATLAVSGFSLWPWKNAPVYCC